MKDLYDDNYKALVKKIEEDSRKWNDIPCSWIRRNNTVKMAIPLVAQRLKRLPPMRKTWV